MRVLTSPLFAVFLGGGLGSCLRLALAESLGSGSLPWATLAANLLGSAIIGLAAGLASGEGPLAGRPRLEAFVIAGLCGGFTTFSLLALESALLLAAGSAALAGGYLAVTLLGSLLAAAVALRLGKLRS